MDNPKSKTLFHFTKSEDAFYSILENGLKFTYNEERYNDVFHYALPMICFCDMPLTMIGEHTIKYGSFGIGFNKNKMINNYWKLLNPVNYIFSKNLLDGAESFLEIAKKRFNEEDEKSKKLYELAINQLAFMKPYADQNNKQVLYNECEWRLIVPERCHIKDFKPINWFWTEEEYQKFKETHKYPMATHLPIFKFTPEEVRFILVDKSISSCVIIDKILNMKTFGGNKIKKDQRYELLTKVVFLDEIKDNY